MDARLLAATAALTLFWPTTLAPVGDRTGAPDREASAAAAPLLTGTVVDDATGAPLEAAQVFLSGTTLGALSNRGGAYTLALGAEWVGRTVEVEVAYIGYAGERRTVTLSDGENRVDFRLAAVALDLAEITVGIPARDEARRQAGSGVVHLRAVAGPPSAEWNREQYAHIEENGFRAVRAAPLSTFSIDVDRASYANVRRFIRDGVRPPVDAVRIEELLNYFPYDDALPEGSAPLAVTTEVGTAPWQPLHRLVRIGLRSPAVEVADLPPANLVFLLDVSGSMGSPDKLPLVQKAMHLLVDQLRPQDRVAMVVYAGAAGLVLPSTPGTEKETIRAALDRLHAGGSTAGGEGLRLAYEVAREHHVDGGTNRVILATDGDFNVGPSSDSEMIRLVEEKREQGTFLTVLGFGTGNLQDAKMEQMADHGNGSYAYIDGLLEARKALVHELGGTLLTVAKDVKIQVEFNPARVAAYRLIGYENRLLNAEDFADDRKDAGEMGAGHSVVALYEVVPVGVESPVALPEVDDLRYARPDPAAGRSSEELLLVKLRYKEPDGDRSRLMELPLVDDGRDVPSRDFRFAAAVAGWGMLLRGSEHRGELTLAEVADLARGALGDDPGGYRAEFLSLVEESRRLDLLASAVRDEPGR